MSSKTLVSIIVPVYNIEKYLHECINSILNQTYTNFELILVDDGSTDSSGAICDDFLIQDPRISVIHKNNGGLRSAVVAGLYKSTGYYIYFVDGDDSIVPEALESVYIAMEKGKYDLAIASYYRHLKNGQKILMDSCTVPSGAYDKLQISEDILPFLFCKQTSTQVITCTRWGKLLRRDIIMKNISFYIDGINLMEDWFIMIPYLLSIKSLYILEESYHYFYRINEESICSVVIPSFIEENILFKAQLCKIIVHYNINKKELLNQLDLVLIRRTFSQIRKFYHAGLFKNKRDICNIITNAFEQEYINYDIKDKLVSFKIKVLLYLAKNKRYNTLYYVLLALELKLFLSPKISKLSRVLSIKSNY